MNPAPKDRPRRKGKSLPQMQPSSLNTVILALAMELRDDITLLRMRADQLLKALNNQEVDK